MAVIDTNKIKKPYIIDRDEDVFIGFKLPVEFGSSMDTSTITTLDAIKYNFIGERKLVRRQAVIIALKGLLERLAS